MKSEQTMKPSAPPSLPSPPVKQQADRLLDDLHADPHYGEGQRPKQQPQEQSQQQEQPQKLTIRPDQNPLPTPRAPRPAIGRAVHYVDPSDASVHWPATIVRVYDETRLAIAVTMDVGRTCPVEIIKPVLLGDGPGTCHWPEIV